MADVEFRVLGVIEADLAGEPVDLGHARQRVVLAVLLVDTGRAVPADQLIHRVWGESPPAGARRTLNSYVSRLRNALTGAPADIRWQRGGYLVDADPASVDMHEYQRLVELARSATDDDQAMARWRQAMTLWRGQPFDGLDVPWLDQVASRLAAQHHAALDEYRDLRLRRGEHAELIPELQAATGANPLDERLAGQLMLALYRSGRQADALTHYAGMRRRLVDELGSDPVPAVQALHHQILTADAELAAPVRPVAVSAEPGQAPVTLPWNTRDFTGREPDLDQLRACAAAADQPGTVAAAVISGSGGVGKTALAVHWAHQPRTADRFPGGRLYLNLQGFSEQEPLTSADALRGLLRQLGVPGAEIPSDPDQAQRLYRHTLDGRRVLVILDNASEAGQVRPLLVGPPGLALITSRNRLTGLTVQEGATHLSLGRLPDRDAQQLTAHLLGGHHPAEAISRLGEVCANLPLAIRLAATAYQAAHPDTRLDEYVEQLAGDRIGLLDATADGTTAITKVLSRSVQRLPPDLISAFHLVGLHPGPRMDVPAIAALLGVAEQRSRRVVRELAGANLLEETSPDRWSMHDLLAEYARDCAGSDADAAYARLLEHYTERLAAEPIDHQWINQERAALLACLRLPAGVGEFERYAPRLGDRLFVVDLYADSGHTYETLRRRCPTDSHAYALATFGIGRAAVWLHEPGAEPLLDDALNRFQQLGDVRGEALTLRELAELNRGRGINQEKVDLRALELFRRAGDLDGESEALMALSIGSSSRGDYPGARERAARALQIARQTGSKRLQGGALRALGGVALRTGDHAAATDHFADALELFTAVGFPLGRATCLGKLGEIASAARRYQPAMEWQRQALAIFVELGQRNGVAYTQLQLGKTALAMNDPAQSREHLTQALRIHRELKNHTGIAFDLIGLADVLLATGEHAGAAEKYRQAAADLAELGFPRGEAEARLGVGNALAAMADHGQAREQLELALGLFETIESPQAAEARKALRQLPQPSRRALPPPASGPRSVAPVRDI